MMMMLMVMLMCVFVLLQELAESKQLAPAAVMAASSVVHRLCMGLEMECDIVAT